MILVHPNLPGQEIDVRDESLPIYRGSGWMTKAEAEEQNKAKTASKAAEQKKGE